MSSMMWPILRRALRHPTRVAVVDDVRTWRSIDLLVGALHLAGRIRRETDNEKIGILLPTSGAFPMALLATWLLDRVAVPINYLLNETERRHIIDDAGLDTVISADQLLQFLGGGPEGVNLIKLDAVSFKGLPPMVLPPFRTPADRLAVILYTSGTSGKPKGVMLTHGNLRFDVEAGIGHAGLSESNGFVGVLPQFHSFGLTALTLIPLRLGAKVVYTARFVPKKLVNLIREHRPDVFMAIPSMFNALANLKQAGPDDLKSLRLAISGGEPLPDQIKQRFEDRFGVEICQGYGLTETSPAICWTLPGEQRPGSSGRVFDGIDVAIVDEQGNHLGPNEQGEIRIRGPVIMAGYHNQPQATAEAIDEAGWFHTGDMGMLDEDGFLYITGRIKDMLIIGGENVFPREIEEVLLQHPSVHDAGVVGRPDPSRGEVPVAFIELTENTAFDETALRTHCREHLAGYKVPKQIRVVDQLPRSGTGKVLRRELRGVIDAPDTPNAPATSDAPGAADG